MKGKGCRGGQVLDRVTMLGLGWKVRGWDECESGWGANPETVILGG